MFTFNHGDCTLEALVFARITSAPDVTPTMYVYEESGGLFADGPDCWPAGFSRCRGSTYHYVNGSFQNVAGTLTQIGEKL